LGTACQIVVRDLMRVFIERHRRAREYESLRGSVVAARARTAVGQYTSAKAVEARVVERRAALRPKGRGAGA